MVFCKNGPTYLGPIPEENILGLFSLFFYRSSGVLSLGSENSKVDIASVVHHPGKEMKDIDLESRREEFHTLVDFDHENKKRVSVQTLFYI